MNYLTRFFQCRKIVINPSFNKYVLGVYFVLDNMANETDTGTPRAHLWEATWSQDVFPLRSTAPLGRERVMRYQQLSKMADTYLGEAEGTGLLCGHRAGC